MKGLVPNITKKLRSYDKSLYAYRTQQGVTMIMRQADRLDASDFGMEELDPSLINPQFLFALTDNGFLSGVPHEWGIERIMDRLKGMDVWRNDSWIHERKKSLKRVEEDLKRQRSNEFRAVAADSRTEFAKAVNDINTSTLEKVDNRRKYGNR